MPETIVIAAVDVATLRTIALADFSDFSERAHGQRAEDAAEHHEWAENAARVLDVLGWDEPVATDCRIEPGRTETWISGLEAAVGTALFELDTIKLESCARLLRQFVEVEADRRPMVRLS